MPLIRHPAVSPGSTTGSAPSQLQVSVLVPTRSRASHLGLLLESLAHPVSTAERFEVLVVDLARTTEPLELPSMPYELRVLRDADGNQGRGLNQAIAAARGELLLFLEEDAVAADDLIASHCRAHAAEPGRFAIRGIDRDVRIGRSLPRELVDDGLPVTPSQLRLPIEAEHLQDGCSYDWRGFALSNLSIARTTLGGLTCDETWGDGIGLGAELGWRLQAAGVGVKFAASAVAAEPCSFDIDAWLANHVRRGMVLARVARRHGLGLLWFGADGDDERILGQEVQARTEAVLPELRPTVERLRGADLSRIPIADRLAVGSALQTAAMVARYRGVLSAWRGVDPQATIHHGPSVGRLTSVIVVTHDGLDMTRRCLERLWKYREDDHPIEIIVVDNGSTDGTRQWLGTQLDLQAIFNDRNQGAPRARNQALAVARGETVVFLDNDAMVGEGWLGRLKYHAEVDGRVGFVGPVSDRAGHGQRIDGVPKDPLAVEDLTRRRARDERRKHKVSTLLSSFCILVRRELLDQLGGFDPRFSPWGFEDDDITLRAHLAGHTNRIALDVLVQHLPYAGKKLADHERLLQRNWTRFATKWGLGSDVAYGQGRDRLERLAQRTWGPAQLYVAPDAPTPADAAVLSSVVMPAPRLVAAPGSSAPLLAQVEVDPATAARLRLSVIVPTYGRPDQLLGLLAGLEAQTLDRRAFEVVVVDDGSPEPIELDPADYGFDLRLLRQDNQGPAAARNLALGFCRAPLTLIFNDDALPARDNLAQHLVAHGRSANDVAVLGTFDFVESARTEPMVQVVDHTNLLFDYGALQPGELHDWRFFWTCNLSVKTDALRASGGFDAVAFREPIVEDVELGYRLGQAGIQVLFHPAAKAGHDHALTAAGYFQRSIRLGVHLYRMYRKHGDKSIVSWAGRALDERTLLALQAECEARLPEVEREVTAIAQRTGELRGCTVEPDELTLLRRRVGAAARTLVECGLLLEANGADLWRLTRAGTGIDRLTVVILAGVAGALVPSCVQSVRDALEDDIELTIEVVAEDDLEVPDGVVVVAAGPSHDPGHGPVATASRQILGATTDWVLLVDADAVLGPGALGRLLYHAVADGRVASVGTLANDADHGQRLERLPGGSGSWSEVSAWVATHQHRRHRYQRMVSGHCLLVRRQALAEIGGLDSQVPATLVGDDLSLRLHLAGWRNRVALDVFVERASAAQKIGVDSWRKWVTARGWAGIALGDIPALVANLEASTPTLADLQPSAPLGPQLVEASMLSGLYAAPRPPRGQPGKASTPTVALPTVALCVIVRDEEDNIGRCLESAAPFVDEMVVVDTGSTDRTKEIAKEHGASVYRHRWQDDFARARNQALQHAKADWVLTLDADEVLLEPSGEALRRLCAAAGERTMAYMVTIYNRHDRDGREQRFISHAPRLHPRTDAIRWRGRIHEQLETVTGPALELVHTIEVELGHDGYMTAVMQGKDKARRNRRLLSEAIQRDPTNPLNFYFLGQEHAVAGDPNEALVWLQKALDLGRRIQPPPHYLAYAYALATGACFELGEYARGVAIGSEGAREYPYADLLCNLASCFLARNELDAAWTYYEQARGLDGRVTTFAGDAGATTWRPLMGLGAVRAARAEHAEALELYEEALGYDPLQTRLNVRAAQMAFELGALTHAAGLYDRALEIEPDDQEANLGKVACLLAAGHADRACEILIGGLERDSSLAAYRGRLAEILIAANAAATALEVLTPALQQEPRSSLLYTRMGQALSQLGRHGEALKAYVVAVAADPKNAEARQGLAAAQREMAMA